jgi:DNA-binding MarR family transcriptional regulator
MDENPLTADWSPEQTAVMRRLHDWAIGFAQLNQHLAAWTHLPNSDANALSHIIWSAEADQPLSPADLARRIGMTSGATTVLLNRLETAGHIRRSREHADRRRVTLWPQPAARETARLFLAAAGTEIAAVLRQTSAEELRAVTGFLERISTAAAEANTRLSRTAAPPTPC